MIGIERNLATFRCRCHQQPRPSRTVSLGLHILSELRSVGTLVLTSLHLVCGIAAGYDSGEFTPLCRDFERDAGGTFESRCWTPVANQPGCHFRGLLSLNDNTSPVFWSGKCDNGRAVGPGTLTDDAGNRAEGRFVEGLKHGPWTRELVNRMTLEETHDMGVWSGPWIYTTAEGIRLEGMYEDNSPEGVWSDVWPDGYSMVGPREKGRKHGTWTVTWPDGDAATIEYVEGRIHGEVTVTRNGRALGTLIYWKGERLGPGLPPTLIPAADE